MSEHLAKQPEIDVNEPKVIGIGSLVKLRLEDGEIHQIHLYEERPAGGDDDETYEAISVDSPIGKAILHHGVGDSVTYKTPSGLFTLDVCAVA